MIAGSLLLLFGATAGTAQNEFELTPFWGYRFSNSVDAESARFQDIEPDDSDVYGLAVGYWLGPNGQIELLWSRQDTDLQARGIRTGTKETLFGIKVDDWQVGGRTIGAVRAIRSGRS